MNFDQIKLPRGMKLPRVMRRIAKPSPVVAEQPVPNPTLEVQVLPPLLDGESSVAVAQPGPETLEQFTDRCERLFGDTLKPRLAIKNRKTGALDFQQWHAAIKAAYFTGVQGRNWQVIAPTGQGKSYFLAGKLTILSKLWPERFDNMEAGLLKGRFPWVIIQPAKSVIQMRNVLASFGVHHCIVCTLAGLRGSLGEGMLEWRTVIVNQQPVQYPFWNADRAPIGLDVDESQQVKNESSQSDMIESAALHGIPTGFMSATPYSRPCQVKVIAVALAPIIGGNATHPIVLTPKLWSSFVKDCCGPKGNPTDWSPAALERIQRYLEPQTIRWAIDYPHKIITKSVGCDFISVESRMRYVEAFEEWQEIRASRGKNPLIGMAEVLVAQAKYNQIAEEERVDPLLRYALDFWLAREASGKRISIIFGFAFRTSADKAAARLREILGDEEYNKKVGFIVGGRDCSADHAAFQRDSKPFLILTIACGGAALSLDHNEQNKRQRYMFCSAVWNDIQMAQLAGRTQRLLTQSTSYMYVMYFKGTEEAKKLQKVRRKIASLKMITTHIKSDTADGGQTGTFVGDIDEIEHVDAGRLRTPIDDDEEELAAERIVGTAARLEFEDGGEETSTAE
jgi:hypothetical protein